MPFYRGHKISAGRQCSQETRDRIALANRKERIKKTCRCGVSFEVLPSKEKRAKYCSVACLTKSKLGKVAWNKGLLGFRANEKRPWMPKGEKHWSYKGGRSESTGGYTFLSSGGLILEHRKVMEDIIGRKLQKEETVHHWDKNKKNNAIENLCLFRSQAAHSRLHAYANRQGIEVKLLRFEQPWLATANQ